MLPAGTTIDMDKPAGVATPAPSPGATLPPLPGFLDEETHEMQKPPPAPRAAPQRIAVVDDEPTWCEAVRNQLVHAGFEVAVFLRGSEFLEQFAVTAPDLVILDFYLDEESGLDVCREVRRVSAVPLLMLTGLDDGEAVVACLEAGADDYVLKLQAPEQLLARVRALLRRSGASGGSTSAARPFGDLGFDPDARIVHRGDASLQFGEREFALLAALLREYPHMLDRERCSWLVLRREWIPGDRALDVLVSRVREKLRKLDSRIDIVTVRSRGYVLRDPETETA